MNIGKALRDIRKGKKITQKELAETVGISNTYLSEIENNSRRPSIDILKKISDSLGVNILYLILKSLEENDLKNENKAEFLNKVNSELDNFSFNL
ncbi:helix-turn-helix protein [Winogradskyella wandonensis]|uniref:Helix-turn-helix protein n=1 Tax=Winogradskyella wandonensis TaxID=1442586 RepID=A0A4V2PTV2_9FLAO|nr:helix-turn-helix transcriptional regulator [Winogradskyella wandonensis]TCK67921.1 helix-turn-helix protein [Winogradskyella wandonensis]